MANETKLTKEEIFAQAAKLKNEQTATVVAAFEQLVVKVTDLQNQLNDVAFQDGYPTEVVEIVQIVNNFAQGVKDREMRAGMRAAAFVPPVAPNSQT